MNLLWRKLIIQLWSCEGEASCSVIVAMLWNISLHLIYHFLLLLPLHFVSFWVLDTDFHFDFSENPQFCDVCGKTYYSALFLKITYFLIWCLTGVRQFLNTPLMKIIFLTNCSLSGLKSFHQWPKLNSHINGLQWRNPKKILTTCGGEG